MTVNKKWNMYIAVELESGDRRVWLPLPATKAQFAEALAKIDGQNGDFRISEYNCRIPGAGRDMLMKSSLSMVNLLASRLNKLSPENAEKLCAIGASDYYFEFIDDYIEYTYLPNRYTLLPGITDEKMLGEYHLGRQSDRIDAENIKQHIDRRDYGRKLADAEAGDFTALGYLTAKNKWQFHSFDRLVPEYLQLKGSLNEEIFGDWEDYYIGA
jgi:hypothetical protein